MKTDQEIAELLSAKEAELRNLITSHELMRKKHEAAHQEFLQKVQANQLRVTHLEGCIAQLKELLPPAAPEESSEAPTT